MKIGVPKEIVENENRVALTPDLVARLTKSGLELLIETGAGQHASFTDEAYTKAGATIAPDATSLYGESNLVAKVQKPVMNEALGKHEVTLMRPGTWLIGFLQPLITPELVRMLAESRITAFSMDAIPRTTRAQYMDALSSMSTVAGYKSVLLAASASGKFFPLLTTAAGTIPPSKVFVLGAGVAGLMAIATAKRLGAVVSAFDVRPVVKEQVESLGASFVAPEAVTTAAEAAGGYAAELGEDQQRRELELIHRHIREMDLVITTALIPGRPAPRLITGAMVRDMRSGAVIVDLAAEAGGNCELTRPDETVREGGVTVLGPLNLPATVPLHASQMYSRNLQTLLQHLVKEGALAVDLADEITGAMVVTHQGEIRSLS